MIALLISAGPRVWALIGNHSLAAVGIFVVGKFRRRPPAGRPGPRNATLLAFAASCRYPATALVSANFPNTDEHAAVALYGLVNSAAGAVYALWLRRHRAVAG